MTHGPLPQPTPPEPLTDEPARERPPTDIEEWALASALEECGYGTSQSETARAIDAADVVRSYQWFLDLWMEGPHG